MQVSKVRDPSLTMPMLCADAFFEGGCRPCAMQMENWAKAMPQVQFLCVCVESQGVAQMFDRMFRFEHAVNCYIPSRPYMPVGYGQLGCSGFIVSDAHGNAVSLKTKAYLQYGEAAFRHVEAILGQQVSLELPPPPMKKQKGGENDVVTNTYLPPSVGIKSMDEEHEACAEALKGLVVAPSAANLERVVYELERHFDHEEMLMIKYGFGGDRSAFSALDSHIQDHVRILQLARAELERIRAISAVAACSSEGTP